MNRYRSQSEFLLDADTTDYLLTLLPSVSDLRSLILTSRRIYHIFQPRSDSIVHAVVSNQIGSVLPQALRLARCENKSLRQQDVEDLPKEDNIPAQSISRNEAILLVRNHRVVQVLEDHFSWRYGCPLNPSLGFYSGHLTGTRTENQGLAFSHLKNPSASSVPCIE